MGKIKEGIGPDLKSAISDEIMNVKSFNIDPLEAVKSLNDFTRDISEDEDEEVEFIHSKMNFYDSDYDPETKTIVGAYMITDETDKSIEVLNIIENRHNDRIFANGNASYSILPNKVRLPKSQIEILGDVEGKDGMTFIRIPYWLFKKQNGKLDIRRIDMRKSLSFNSGQLYNQDFLKSLNDDDVRKMLSVVGSDEDVKRLNYYISNYMENKKEGSETTEATSSGGSGQYSQPLFSGEEPKKIETKEDSIKGGLSDGMTLKDIAKKHDKKKYKHIDDMVKHLESELKKGIKVEMEHTNSKSKASEIAMDHLFEDPNYYNKLKKIEATEATSSASAGQYSTPAFVAKNSKNWRGNKKTQIPGGKFVKIKDKCKKFPYCNQGDIKALKLFENDTVKKAISNICEKFDVSENVVKSIIVHEYENKILNK